MGGDPLTVNLENKGEDPMNPGCGVCGTECSGEFCSTRCTAFSERMEAGKAAGNIEDADHAERLRLEYLRRTGRTSMRAE